MKKSFKRLVSLALVVLSLCSFSAPALAAGKAHQKGNQPSAVATMHASHTSVITTKTAYIITTVKTAK